MVICRSPTDPQAKNGLIGNLMLIVATPPMLYRGIPAALTYCTPQEVENAPLRD